MNPLYTAWLIFMGVISVFFMYYVMLQNKRTQLSKLKSTNQRLEMDLDDVKSKIKKLRRDEETLAAKAEAVLAATAAAGEGRRTRIKKKRTSIVNFLLQAKVITPEQVAAALEHQQTRSPDKRIEEILVTMGFMTKKQMLDFIEKAKSQQTAAAGAPTGGAVATGDGGGRSALEEEELPIG